MLLDLLFPKTCLGCGRLGIYICSACREKLVFIQKDVCVYCKKPADLGLTHVGCTRKMGIDGVMSVMRYDETSRKIIKGIKYRLIRDAFRELFSTLR